MVSQQNKNMMATLPNMALKTILQFKNMEKWKYHALFFSFFPTQIARNSDTFLPPVTTYIY